MSGKYESPKPDGYLETRNNVYLQRMQSQQRREIAQQDAGRDLPPQSKENYGKKSY